MDIDNTNLETLAIENVLLYPVFDNTITNYDAEVSNSTTDLNVLVITEDENASASIVKSSELVEGNNVVTINVTAADGITKKSYVINVYKRNQQEEAVYEQEKEENKQKLEQIYNEEESVGETYNAEKMSTNANFDSSGIEKGIIIVAVLVIVVIIAGIFFFLRNLLNKKNF